MARGEKSPPLIVKLIGKGNELPCIVPSKQSRSVVFEEQIEGPGNSQKKQKDSEIENAFPIEKERHMRF